MEHHATQQLAALAAPKLARLGLLLVLAAVLGQSRGASSEKHHRKIIIHVPYIIKNHHHTHTVYKMVKGKGHEGGGGEESGAAGDLHDNFGGASLEQGEQGRRPLGEAGGGHGSGEVADLHGEPHADHFDQPPVGDAEFAVQRPETPKALHGGHLHSEGDFFHQQQHRVREEDAHVHRHEQSTRLRNHHHQHLHDASPTSHPGGRGHAHFHSTFVVDGNDGRLQETESSESSEFTGHRNLEPHRIRAPFTEPQEHESHPYEPQDHSTYNSHPPPPQDQEEHFTQGERFTESTHAFNSHPASPHEDQGEHFTQEERYTQSSHQHDSYNAIHSEQRPEESQHHVSQTYQRDHFHFDKPKERTLPRIQREPRGSRNSWSEERPRRQRHEAKEYDQGSTSRTKRPSEDYRVDYHTNGHRKFNFNWR